MAKTGRKPDVYKARFLKVLEASDALPRLQRILRQTKNEDVFLKALAIVLERGLGKPVQQLEHTGKDGGEIIIKNVNYADIA